VLRAMPSPILTATVWLVFAVLVLARVWTPERFLIDDAYFYLVTARRLALDGVPSFSGVQPSDGVHPLWLAVLAGWARLVAAVDTSWLWKSRAYLVPEFAALAGAALGLRRLARQWNVPAAPVVAVPLLFVLGLPLAGMECAVSMAALVWLWVTLHDTGGGPARGLSAGMLAAAAVLARLDSVFLVAALVGWHGCRWLHAGLWSRVALLLASAALGFGAWAVPHWLAFGSVLPVSGWLKSTWPHVCLDGLQRRRQHGVWRGQLVGGLAPVPRQPVGRLAPTARALRSVACAGCGRGRLRRAPVLHRAVHAPRRQLAVALRRPGADRGRGAGARTRRPSAPGNRGHSPSRLAGRCLWGSTRHPPAATF
jgi:hypothetical protein